MQSGFAIQLPWISNLRHFVLIVVWGASLLPADAQLPAFPGAEGAGRLAIGGRGGDVYHVTNLADSGPGSLRQGIQTANGPRTIVFQVGGTIRLQSDLSIEKPYLTIAGQTAPGGGITLADRSLVVNGTRDIILQYLRFRTGDTYTYPVGTYEPDSLWIRNSRQIMVDHVSASWGTDEILSVTHNSREVTVQWSLITEALHNAGHSSGNHGYGSLINGGDITFHHNLYAHNRSRNPRPSDDVRLDFVNNVIYGPGGQYGYSSADNDVSLNLVNNYGIDNFNTSAAALYAPDTTDTRVFYQGNYRDANRNRFLDGVDVGNAAVTGEFTRVFSRFNLPQVTTTNAVQAYIDVLSHAGASLARDPVDHRVIGSVINQSGTFIDSQNQVGGWPTLTTAAPPVDSNSDGIPDAWAIAQGLNPSLDYSREYAQNGYTYLENYLHSLTKNNYPNRVSESIAISTKQGLGSDAQVGENRVGGTVISQGAGDTAALQARWSGSQGEHNEYILLRFDLAKLQPGSLTNARLELTAMADGAGRQQYRVLGLENGAAGWSWNEELVEFAGAPGLTFDGNLSTRGTVTQDLLLLGALNVEKILNGQILSFDNPSLTAYLNRAATFGYGPNQTVTLLLQPVSATTGDFLFASKETGNGSLAPRLIVSGTSVALVPEPGSLWFTATGFTLLAMWVTSARLHRAPFATATTLAANNTHLDLARRKCTQKQEKPSVPRGVKSKWQGSVTVVTEALCRNRRRS